MKKYNIMYMNTVVADIKLNDKNMVESIIKYVKDSPMQPIWGDFTNATMQEMTRRFYVFIKDRCYEDCRVDLPRILEQAGMETNNPYEWIKISHGVTFEDFFWIKEDWEDLKWDDVKVR